MGSKYVFLVSQIICLWLLAPLTQADQHQRETYIIYMGDRINLDIPAKSLHIEMLSGVLHSVPSHKVSEHLLYTYDNFHGCVALLTENEAKIIAGMDGVVSIFPNEKIYHHTTRSWDFMGFPQTVERSNIESDVIVGVIDTGIWPESQSFRDDGFGPPPTKWKGRCQTSLNFTCNNKIIGAQYFRADGNLSKDEVASPRDTNGHGTHTASTIAGGIVETASFLGLGEGIARGGVPSARIAVYKPCWSDEGCLQADVLAAFDAAISDGVDIISVSLGSRSHAVPYFRDPIAIGAFHAMKKGILTSASAGNKGPGLQTLSNFAPWLLSVGAATMDRKFSTKVQLDNGMVFEGISLNTFDLENKTFPLIYGGDSPDNIFSNSSESRFCKKDSLNKTLVEGKIVVCDILLRHTEDEVFVDGAAGTIMHFVEPHYYDIALSFPLPASYIRADDAARVISYTRNLTSTPFGTIHKSVEVKDTSAPYVASFSSRGPHPFSPHILKPDVIAPGVDILAAWSPVGSVSQVEGDPRSVPYTILSGTSMACPHATAVAAYVKSFHPTWSAAAIRSALMTTALPMSRATNEEAELAYGSGHINPLKAVQPGLVYDAAEGDYVKFLCSQDLDDIDIRLITGDNSTSCHQGIRNTTNNWDLNYPSIALTTSLGPFDTIFTRTVTNVGSSNSTYNVVVTTPQDQALSIKVQPSVLSFKTLGQKLSFTVRVSGSIGIRALMSASLVWDDGHHQVRSPIVVFNLS
ncbi:cucumisin-like [Spinacia oleracea]|uniref:Cucumisin-like n=1 Tax=Spinacia oleracea TaxID=3562 RepID=A0A9R0HWL8_SPIOL|nr:cucumisin-like [Spinacia oleracea]